MTLSSWSHIPNFIFQKGTLAKLSALRSINCLFLKLAIKYLSNDESTVVIAMMVQNL